MSLFSQVVLTENKECFNEGDQVKIGPNVNHAGEVGTVVSASSGNRFYIVEINGKKYSFHKSDLICHEELDESQQVFKDYEKWQKAVKAQYPKYASKMRFNGRVRFGFQNISAEVPGLDRSFGVWDDDKEEGVVLSEHVLELANIVMEEMALNGVLSESILSEMAVVDEIINTIKGMLVASRVKSVNLDEDMVDTAKEKSERRIQSAAGPWIIKAFVSALKYGQKKFCICYPANNSTKVAMYVPA